MNSIRRIAPTNLLLPQLSKQDSPFPRNRARVSVCLPAAHPPSRLHTRERVVGTRASRITRRARRASGTAGFNPFVAPAARPPYALPPSLFFSSPTREHSRRMRAAECPRYALVRGRPPVKMRKTRQRRILDSAIPRRVVPAVSPSGSAQQLSASTSDGNRSYFRRSEFRVV